MNELSKLAIKHGTDKWNHHWYTDKYEFFLSRYKNLPVKLLEIGVGGYHHPDQGGASLRMWKEYFPAGDIFAIDIFDKSLLVEPRITILEGSQSDPQFLQHVYNRMGKIDVVIDDGSHKCQDIIASFLKLFPLLENDGVYIIEDTATSYWSDYGGSMDLNTPGTTLHFFMQFIHGLNHHCIANYPLSEFNKIIKGITFYRELIIIEKGEPK